jgi:Lrp/AsnC family transcriptional regulator for asnA, asnC and gidA
MKVDELDRAMIRLLQEDGRIPFAEMAKRLGRSESTLRFRFKRLMDKGVIRGVVALANPRAVGLTESAALFIKADASKLDDVLARLCSLKEVPHVYQFTGDYDAIAIVMGKDVDDLDSIVRRVKTIPGILDVTMMLTLRVLKSDVKYAIA